MKVMKYVICFFIYFIGVLIIGESQTFRLENFNTPYRYTSLYLQYGQNEQDMKHDILQAADKNNVEVFTFIKNSINGLNEYKIFGSSGAEDGINKFSNVYAQEYKSLLLGDIKFSFYPLEQLQGMEHTNDFYVIGDSKNAELFKVDLINKYAGNFPQEGYSYQDTHYTLVGIWLLMILFTVLLTYYDVLYQKKENLIRISMGEPLSIIVGKNIVKDTLIYTLFFVVIFILLSKVTSVALSINFSIVGLIILLTLNALVYLSSRSYKIRETFSNTNISSNKLLTVNYGLKLISVIITVFVITSNLVVVEESYNLYKQKSFFERHAEYSFVPIWYRPVMKDNGEGDPKFAESEQLQAEFYTTFFKKASATILSMVHSPLANSTPTMMANQNSFSYLANNINELKSLPKNKDIYFILPESLAKNEDLLAHLIEEYHFYENHNIQDNYGVIYYKDTVNIVAIDYKHIYGSNLVKNPIIIYNNLSPEDTPLNYEPNRAIYIYDIMYNITDEEYNQFIQEHKLTESNAVFNKINILDKFNESWKIAKQILYINVIFSLLVLLLEFMIINTIIKLEYDVNALELSVKKILGYSVWQKNRKIIMITIATSILSVVITILISHLFEIGSYKYLLVGGFFIIISELVVIILSIRRIERIRIHNILKGGNI